jgi:hypothetical protein
MPRRETVGIAARRAYRNRDVHQFIWSMLKLTEEEIEQKVPTKNRTFSGRDVVGFVNTLINLERVRKEIQADDDKPSDDFGNWGAPPKLEVVDDEDEDEDDE